MQNNTRWKLKAIPEEQSVLSIKEQLNVPEVFAKLLIQRNIDTFNKAKTFFSPEISDLHDPFLMKDMDIAVKRIQKAIDSKENILVYGDYDVDGTTAVSLMYLFLKSIYPNVSFYIPDRYNEGYGISYQGIDFAEDNNFSLIIALDCGIKAIDKIDYANEKNIDFIICDHHLPGEKIPDAVAVLDPQRFDCDYPFKFLSGCGVGFKLIQALSKSLEINEKNIYNYLDLVVVSIAADIVPLVGENRILAFYGLKHLLENPRPGLIVMLPKEKKPKLSITNIVFGMAPKINAAGRIDHASKSVELLTADTEANARAIIYQITEFNNQRRELDTNITEEALEQIEDSNQLNNYSTVVYHPDWHKGVLGIVASRLIETHYKPTLVFTKGKDDVLVASARSVKEFDVYKALEECSEYLDQFGGHMYAAGLSMSENNFEAFKEKFENVVKNNIKQSQTIREIEIDLEINLDDIDNKFFRLIGRLEPFGPENMTPVFVAKNLCYGGKIKVIGKTQEHLQFNVFQLNNRSDFDVTAFGMADLAKRIKKDTFDMVFTLDENYWQGKVYYKLLARDIKFHDA